MEILKPIKVVIADDSPMFREMLKVMFKSSDKYEVIDEYTNGEDLVISSSVNIADVVLVDIDMPIKDGVQAAREINYQNASIPLIAITLHKEAVYLHEIISAGFKGFIYKPEVATQLFSTIEKVLEKGFVFPASLKM